MRFGVAAVAILVGSIWACGRSGEETKSGRERPSPCTTEQAEEVTHRPDFEGAYLYCAKGSRAIGRTETIACLKRSSGLPEDCGGCYSVYKACVLRNCFRACFTTRPEPVCLLCRRNFCRGTFGRCAGTYDVFPGSPKR
jgi:hypothetical protein